VICGVNALNRDAFDAFTEGVATDLPARLDAILVWFENVRQQERFVAVA
jgi:hypothetical protein